MRSTLAIVAVAAAVLFIIMTGAGPGSRFSNGYQYLTTGSTTQQNTGNPQVQAAGATDYHALARQDAIDNHIDSDLFERQIQQESGFNPKAESVMGAEGIAQIMPSTAKAWGVDPLDPVASLSKAAAVMSWYQNKYGSWQKALSAYNGGPSRLDYCIATYSDWLSCMPAETQNYVRAIGG